MTTVKSSRVYPLMLISAFIGLAVLVFGVGAAFSKPKVASPTITAQPPAMTSSQSASFSFTGPAGATFRCSLDLASYTTCTSPKSYASLTDGSHRFRVIAVQGSSQSSATTANWAVDTSGPEIPILTTKPTDPTPNATNDFEWTVSESGLTFECSENNGAFQPCSSPHRWVIDTGNYGQKQFAVRAVDPAGNKSAEAFYRFKYEKGLPDSGVPFTISGTVDPLPIGVWKTINVTITNPNSVPIFVNALTVDVSEDSTPSGCRRDDNISVEQSTIGSGNTLTVPAGASNFVVPASMAPRMRLRNLPDVNQDVCKNKSFGLTFTGSATN